MATKQNPPVSRAAYEKKVAKIRGGLRYLFKNVSLKIPARDAPPYLQLDPPIHNIGMAQVFTATTKMIAPSFSLPAGPINLGGSCPVAGVEDLIADARLFICHSCYAINGKYGAGNVVVAQAARLFWASRAAADGTLGEQLHHALFQYHKKTRNNRDGRALNPNFFRIHDSGDCFSFAYYDAWVYLASQAPKIKFWMPTRNWALGQKWIDAMSASGRPKNLVVRPSALHFGEGPPRIPGLDTGTTSTSKKQARVLDCPAYALQTGNCEDAKCRVCWNQPRRAVSYHPHGTAPKTNPTTHDYQGAVGLYALWQQYKDTVDTGHGAVFEAWLFARGVDPNSYTEEEWVNFYKRRGASNDEIAAYLEEGAEWQA